MLTSSSLHVCDACSLLNLVASRRFAEIAHATPGGFVTAEQAAAEVLYVRRGGSGTEADEREPVDLKALQEQGLLAVIRLESHAEIAAYVDFALEMDDGEAASCALAVQRGGTLVTDDRKARRVIGQRSSQTPVLTTAQVIKMWADQVGLASSELAQVLLNVEERASFRPGRHDPVQSWWDAFRHQR